MSGLKLRLRLIGRMDAWSAAGERVLPRSRKARAMLAYLALQTPAAVTRSRLADLLWSRRGEEQARGSLRQALYELQETLARIGAPVLAATREALALRPDAIWIDAREAENAVESRSEALDLVTDELLTDLEGLDPAWDAWLAERRRQLRHTALDLANRLLEAAANPAEQVAAARRVLGIDAAQEAAWRALIRAEAERGDRGAALAAWEQCRTVLAERFRTTPSPETVALAEELRVQGSVAVPLPVRRPSPRGARLGVAPLLTVGTGDVDHLSIALAEEITSALAHFRSLSLVDSSALAAATAGKAAGGAVEAAARELGLDFLVSGTVQCAGARVRVNLRLTDLRPPPTVVWAQRFDRDITDVLSLQDEIASEVVARMDPEILLIEASRAADRSGAQPCAYDLLLRAIPAIYRLDKPGFEAAGALLAQATALEPDYAAAHAWHAYWHLFLVCQGWTQDDAGALARAEALASRAVTLDPADAQALAILGHVRTLLHHHVDETIALHERALALNPNLPMAWVFSSMALSCGGEHAEALRRWDHYKRLAPLHPHAFFFDSARLVPLLFLRRFEDVDQAARRTTALHHAFSFPYKLWLPALGHLGRTKDIAAVRQRLLMLEPNFTLEKALRRIPMRRTEDRALYEEGLRRATIR